MEKGGLPARVIAEASPAGAAGKKEWSQTVSRISTAGQGKEEASCQTSDLTSLVGTVIFHSSLYHKFEKVLLSVKCKP